MKISITGKICAAILTAVFCFGCSLLPKSDANKTSPTAANQDSKAAQNPAEAKSAATPCANKFYPVKNGLKRNYNNSTGDKTMQTIEYKEGEASFIEVTTLKDVNVRHVWNCTSEGLIAGNYGSAAAMTNMQLEPKHVSGVTMPPEDQIQIGKTWTAVYQATGTSQLGAIDMTVELRNTVVSIDDEVKTPGGTFKAVKVDVALAYEMKMNGKKTPVPPVKTTVWFAPNVGMVKTTGSIGGISNTMEYTGDQ